uniref:HCLS1-associated protein X-1 n=1 Tax=Graphocephala atropunctata TaxID=36148 RepID=A0A1B6M9W7_9HEMI
MSFYEFFHKFFEDRAGGNTRPPNYDDGRNGYDQPRPPSWDSDNEDRTGDFDPIFDFKIISDPLEMHRLFEKQINEVFKVFTSPEGFPGIFESGSFGFPNPPAIEENKSPRDHYLKPGINKPHHHGEIVEEDASKRSGWSTSPLQDGHSQPHGFSSFRSVIRKTITLPDGTLETEEIIRNSDGTEERTESHSKPDKSDATFFDVPCVSPDISGFFDFPRMPELKTNTIPKDQFLKPGYEKYNPHEAKVDKDLDKQILQSGIESLPPFTKEPQIVEPNQNFSFKSISRRTVTLPSGVVETEVIVRNPDGTEQRTVTQIQPDNTTTSLGPGGYDMAKMDDSRLIQSFTLRGIKDLMEIFFK